MVSHGVAIAHHAAQPGGKQHQQAVTGVILAMFYKPGYTPETYLRTGVFVAQEWSDPHALGKPTGQVGNFVVVDWNG